MQKQNYQIVLISNNKQIEYIGYYSSAAKANKKFYKLLKDCEKVKFPVRHINIGRSIKEAKYELVIIKKIEEGENHSTLLRNEYGEYIEHETNNENWIVYDKAPYDKEETFWVYGYHPLVQRKTYDFIFNELLKSKANRPDNITSIMVFKNKLLIDSFDGMELITCKNKSDCIRLYNLLENESQKAKLKYVFFGGDWSFGYKRKMAIDKIKELTNWNELKICRSTTRP